jgi:hypothetical protein
MTDLDLKSRTSGLAASARSAFLVRDSDTRRRRWALTAGIAFAGALAALALIFL